MRSSARKAASLAGMLMLGDAIAYFMSPRGHVDAWSWRRGPRWYDRMWKVALRQPLGAAMAAVELGAAVALIRAAERG